MTPIVLVKTASRAEAEPGDLVQYRLVIRNPDARERHRRADYNRPHPESDAI